ncbi:MAG TPA: hypothetical protein VN025_03725 [Candidatus Dormibacteraeota bacterium]|jgi:hypothetical protein|nr:hypothetical protein [Candidatus Dormibacteraeota bacterium]
MSRSSQILWVLFKTLLFTIFVPGTVGVWAPYRMEGPTDLRLVFEYTSVLRLAVGAVLFWQEL